MNIVLIVQARMGSTRLPGKVMKMICGETVLAQVLKRVKKCNLVDKIVVATTSNKSDDLIVQESINNGAEVYRGSELNVLNRYYLAAKAYAADIIVRITSDCPLLDSQLLHVMLSEYLAVNDTKNSIDYLSNTLDRKYPRGLDIEIFNFNSLEKAYQQASTDYEKEHVTPYIYNNPDIFLLKQHLGEPDLSHYRWTLDTQEDLKLIESIFSHLGKNGEEFSTQSILDLYKELPELYHINSAIQQKCF